MDRNYQIVPDRAAARGRAARGARTDSQKTTEMVMMAMIVARLLLMTTGAGAPHRTRTETRQEIQFDDANRAICRSAVPENGTIPSKWGEIEWGCPSHFATPLPSFFSCPPHPIAMSFCQVSEITTDEAATSRVRGSASLKRPAIGAPIASISSILHTIRSTVSTFSSFPGGYTEDSVTKSVNLL